MVWLPQEDLFSLGSNNIWMVPPASRLRLLFCFALFHHSVDFVCVKGRREKNTTDQVQIQCSISIEINWPQCPSKDVKQPFGFPPQFMSFWCVLWGIKTTAHERHWLEGFSCCFHESSLWRRPMQMGGILPKKLTPDICYLRQSNKLCPSHSVMVPSPPQVSQSIWTPEAKTIHKCLSAFLARETPL